MLENFLFGDSFKEEDVNILTHPAEPIGMGGGPHLCHTTPPPPPPTTHHHHLHSTTSTTTYIHGAPPPSPPDSADEMSCQTTRADVPPDDKEGFFGHPLTKATIAIEGGPERPESGRRGAASGEALLHEFLNLPAMDKQGVKIKDRGGLPGMIGAEDQDEGGGGDRAVRSKQRRGEEVEEETGGGDNVDYMKMFLDLATDSLDNMDHLLGLPQGAGAEVALPLPDPSLPVKVKLEDTRGADVDPTLQKTLSSSGAGAGAQASRGAARRPSQHRHPPGPPQGLMLRRSESEPSGTLTERVAQMRNGLPPSLLSRLPHSQQRPPPPPPFGTVVSSSAECKADHQSVLNRLGLPSVPNGNAGVLSTPTTHPVVTSLDSVAEESGVSRVVVPRGRCVISSSSHPTLRLASTTPLSHDPTCSKGIIAGGRGKGRGSKAGRGRGVQKEEADPEGSVLGQPLGAGSSGSCHRRGTPLSILPPAAPSTSPAGSPASPSSTTTTTTNSLLPPSPAVSVPSPSSVSSPAVLSSALPPGLAAVSPCLPVSVGSAGVQTTGVSCTSPFGPAPVVSPSDSVLLVPLAHSAVLTVDRDTPALVLPTVTTAGNDTSSSETPDSTSVTHPDLSDPPVKQTTKDKLKLRIAQTAMTQPLDAQQQQQHPVDASHHLNHQQKSVLHPDPHATFQQQYSLNHQLQQQQQQQQQQQLQTPQQTPSPREALAYLAEDDLAVMNGSGKFGAGLPHIKREDQFLDYDPHFPPPYSSGAAMQVLYNTVPMATANGLASSSSPSSSAAGLVSMVTNGDSPSAGLSEADLLSQMSSEPVLVQSQFLHLLQPLDMGQPTQQQQQQQQQQQHHQQLTNGYYNPSDNLYIYTSGSNNNTNPLGKADGGLLDLDTEKSVLQYVQQQQQQQQHLQDHYGYGNGFQQYMSAGAVDTSPDSGIGHDPGLSPNAAVMSLKESSLAGTEGHLSKEGKPLKRRKSSQNPVLSRQFSSGSDKLLARNPVIQKLEVNTTGYQYCLEAPISTTQRIEEDRVTYLNKSQYYPLVLENVTPERVPKGVLCKTVIMLVFRDEKSKEEESKAWQFWHSRQHSYKQRILDIDTKNSQGVGPNSIHELAFNAVSVKWNPRDGQVRVSIAVHCLSTDFSNQKGVKGIPLHIQCDTYELFDCKKELLPCHRAYCQIKVFCDKGAERKTRDEERRRTAKVTKPEATGFSRRRRVEEVFHSPCERSEFYNMADLSTSPVFFSPSYATGEFTQNENVSLRDDDNSRTTVAQKSQPSPTQSGDLLDDVSQAKMPRLTSCSSCNKHLTPLMYVKESSDKAYHAIHLEVPTVDELLKAISHKFNKQLGTVTNFFKKSKKGILVRMDDNIVRHYSHETAFLLEINPVGEEEVEVVLVETYQ